MFLYFRFMHRKICSLAILFSFICVSGKTQDQLPPVHDVIRHFYSHYSYEPAEYSDALLLAKKKNGWYVTIVNQVENDKIKEEQLFWDLTTKKYLPMQGFNDHLSDEESESKISDYLTGGNSSFNYYGYERCRYYGFNGWEMALIREYGSQKDQLADTLLDGLSRAYSFYASGFLWDQLRQLDTNEDPLRSPIGYMDMPSPARVMKAKNYIDTALMLYKKLVAKNPAYRGVVGNAAMKLFNEQMHGFHTMSMAGDSIKAREYLNSITPDPIFLSMAKNYLAGLAPNAIVITYGDNDTYQLWYAQQALNYRKDVAVINNSLLGLPPYINLIKSQKLVDFSLPSEKYGSKFFQYARHYAKSNSTTNQLLSEFLDGLQNQQMSQTDATTYEPLYYENNRLRMQVEMAKFQKTTPASKQTKDILVTLPEFIFLSDIMILDIINTNLYKRPVYFTSNYEPLARHLQQEGFVFKMVIDTSIAGEMTPTEALLTEKALNTQIQLTPPYTGGSAPHPGDYADNYYLSACDRLAQYYFEKAIPGKARIWAKKANEYSISRNALTSYAIVTMSEILLKTGENNMAIQWLEKMAMQIENNFNHPSSLVLYLNKPMSASYVLMIQSALSKHNITSQVIDGVVQRLSQ